MKKKKKKRKSSLSRNTVDHVDNIMRLPYITSHTEKMLKL